MKMRIAWTMIWRPSGSFSASPERTLFRAGGG